MSVAVRMANVGNRLTESAKLRPDQLAVVVPTGRLGRRHYEHRTFRELDDDSNVLANAFLAMGIPPGSRLVLLVKPGMDFFALVFALFKAGMVTVLIDPGMGRANLIRCLEAVNPDGFVAIPLAQAIRALLRRRFPTAR